MPVTVVVAGVWVRPLAESARQAGWRVIAMDLFGDADTRAASAQWHCIGRPAAMAIDPALLHQALHGAAAEPGAVGWIAGSGFEPIPQALASAVPGLPLLGTPAAIVRRVRDPVEFFATLDALGLDHPQVAFEAPANPQGWLVKSAGGAGGWHIRHAADVGAGADAADAAGAGRTYWQRMQAGEPMSALFLADGTGARLVALNRLLVRPLGPCPYLYTGAIGPIHDPALAGRIQQALDALVPAFGLRGLASLDFLAHDGRAWLLEVNPRPSASMVLHERAWPGGLLRAHVRAAEGVLPADAPCHPDGVRGYQTVFANRECCIGPALATELARRPDCHDLPAAGSRFAPGEPVFSVSAQAAHADAVLAALDARAGELRCRLSPCDKLAA